MTRLTKPRIARVWGGPMPFAVLTPAHRSLSPTLAFCPSFGHAVQCLDVWLQLARDAPEPLLPALPRLRRFRLLRPGGAALN